MAEGAGTIARRRVVVTGLGVCSPLGLDQESFWAGCLAGRRAIAPIPSAWLPYARYRSRVWAPLPPLSPAVHGLSVAEQMRLDPTQVMCLVAARQAIAQSGLVAAATGMRDSVAFRELDPERAGVAIGTSAGGISSTLTSHLSHRYEQRKEPLRRLVEAGDPFLASPQARSVFGELADDIAGTARFNPFTVPMQMSNASAAQLAIRYTLMGACTTVSLACASGTAAIGAAWRAIASGELDLVLAGGTEYFGDPSGSIFRSFDASRTLTSPVDLEAVDGGPFDTARDGFLFAEGGSGMLVLEDYERAMARGARPIAEIVGYAENNDAHNIMAPEPEGRRVEAVIRRVMAQAGVDAAEVGYFNAHGTGTIVNDQIEAAVIGRIFGRGIAVSSTKSLIGHTIGASGAIEAVVCCLSLDRGMLHPCANLRAPIADLDFVMTARAARPRLALSLSVAFGGHNTVLLFAAAR